MQLHALLRDDDAVSPVIGIILMVAITVLLAATTATFVLGLGQDNTNSQPVASFSWDYEQRDANPNSGPTYGIATVSHDGGDSIKATNLYIRGEGLADASEIADPDPSPLLTASDPTRTWVDGGTTKNRGGESVVTSGNDLSAAVRADYQLSVVWQSGDQSTVLAQDTGPGS